MADEDIEEQRVRRGRTRLRRDRLQPFLRRLLRHGFREWSISRVLSGTDRTRHQTACFLRVILERAETRVPVMVIYPEETGDLTNRLLSAAVLWWDRLTRGRRRNGMARMLLLLPETWSERLLLMLPKFRIRFVCYKYQPGDPRSLRQIYPRPVSSSEIRSPYVMFNFAGGVPGPLAEIQTNHPELDLTYRQNRWELGYLGLRVFWYDAARGEYLFDLERPTIWTPERNALLEQHLQNVVRIRRFPPLEPGNFYYTVDHEQWLESLIRKDHRILNPDFTDMIYSQVPTCLDGERKILDLLTATRAGRLAVIELKVEKDLNLIFQGIDYWERVEHHLVQGDFQRAGYFEGLKLSAQSPVLYLVSPLFEYHRVLPVLRRYLKTEVSLTCIGINTNWREGIKVLRRFEF
ncbi:MAG: hypothetical protein EHM23_29890 [Acidobacteria bacterium]|nr:MAG: hypothetical protein EHM23_29890 [Acidobacteriota bacterium]